MRSSCSDDLSFFPFPKHTTTHHPHPRPTSRSPVASKGHHPATSPPKPGPAISCQVVLNNLLTRLPPAIPVSQIHPSPEARVIFHTTNQSILSRSSSKASQQLPCTLFIKCRFLTWPCLCLDPSFICLSHAGWPLLLLTQAAGSTPGPLH